MHSLSSRGAFGLYTVTCCILLLTPGNALAQEQPVPAGTPLPPYAQSIDLSETTRGVTLPDNDLPNIMITGYWPPTNEMLRQFSPNPAQNPGAYVGADWEGRGYNIIALFPEFPDGLGKGVGDFEVDYQDTSADWWYYTDLIKPLAIITFSRANTTNGWELEGGNRNYALSVWTNDYLTPFDPTPDLPIANEPVGQEYFSTLPIDAIIADVTASGADVDPFSTVIDNGRFLSNYIGYHGNWYHELHADPNDPDWTIASGHIHVGGSTDLAAAVLATEVTLRTYITFLDTQLPIPGDLDGDGDVDFDDLNLLLASYNVDAGGDIDGDGDTDFDDLNILLSNYGT